MAFIYGKKPSADPVDADVRVVIKLIDRGPGGERGVQPNKDANVLSSLRRVAPDADFKPYFSEEEQLRAALSPPFNRYLSVEVRDREAGAALVRRLRTLPEIEETYVEGGPTPPPTVNPDDDPRSANQGYLGPAPAGIDARWAWSLTSGAGVGFVDLEQGWTLNHEDLAAAGITLISGLNQDFTGHGTSVLGEVAAVDNQLGGVGIAPDATVRVVSQWLTSINYKTAAAILSAVQAMSVGDVLLLEAQMSFNGMSDLPVEVEIIVFDAIVRATEKGIVVIEAAGNGSHDLDTFLNNENRNIFNRASADFRDSGAIMVGAASSTAPHVRLDFSNFGSRIDCYGWGENINTTGDGWTGASTDTYTRGFGGTSGASPIVAGAAVLIQAWRKSRGEGSYTPGTLRDILSSVALNTSSANPANDQIGVMPNVRAIIEAQIA